MAESFEHYFRDNALKLVTAESCTAGYMVSLLGGCEGCGNWLEAGFVTYSPAAKKSVLDVKENTIQAHGLTSEEVAREMALGALARSQANVAIANTGIAGPEAVDGIAAGTVCFAWAFSRDGERELFTETRQFPGDRNEVRETAARYGIDRTLHYHSLWRDRKC